MSSPKKTSPLEQDPPLQEPKTKIKRRKRDDQKNRDYVCGCGKSYLSYPALYTHLKQKHNGKKPPETDIPNKRKVENKQQQEQLDYDYETALKEEDEKLEDFLGYLNGYRNYLRENNIEINLFHDPTLNQPPVNCLLDFPSSVFQLESDYQPILNNLQLLVNDEAEESDSKTCNLIFSSFLFKISKYVSKQCYFELGIFLCLLRKTINKINETQDKAEDYCGSHSASHILDYANDFITVYFPKFLKDFDSKGFELLGINEEKKKNVIFLTQYFGNWLYANNLTNLKLEINYE